MRARSLRARLVATVLLLLAVATAVIAVVTAIALRDFLVDRLDDDLRSATARFTRSAPPSTGEDRPPPPVDSSHFGPGQQAGTLGAVLRGGEVVGASVIDPGGTIDRVPASEYADLVAVPVGAPPRTVDLGPLGDYRITAVAGRNGDVIMVGLPERGVQDTVTRLVVIELVVAAVALTGAGVAGAVLVRRELRPLDRVAATAARVSALPLDRGEVELAARVADADPRTEVGQVGGALNRMLDHVGAALAARQESEMRLRQFVADASHELRTPLAAIRGYAELTRRTPLPAETAHSLTRISSQAERMTTLVEDLLLLARLDAGRPLDRAPVDLTRLVVDAVSDAHAAGPDHRWELDLPAEPVTVPGDGSRLAQVLANLLANARTHTPPGTAVRVALGPAPGGARLTVTDEGPGIPPELQSEVFERFARGSASRSRDNGSTGLGLAIVDAVVAAHGGSVTLVSAPGRTEFAVWLPAV